MNSNYFVHWHICIRRANPPQLRTIFLSFFYWKGWHTPERFVLFPPSPSLGESWIHPWGRVQFILQSMKEFINVSMTTLSFYVILLCVWAHVLASKCAFACFRGVVITMESFKSQNYVNVWLMFSLGIVSDGFATISMFLRLKSLKGYAVNFTWLLNIYVDLSFLGVKFRKLSDIVITFLLVTEKKKENLRISEEKNSQIKLARNVIRSVSKYPPITAS